ncbi:TIR domain-containing protein [Nocardia sp. NRRL S-836]|uniref:TIR domain-containing protein n=1 Tax=Nocardia sp. NRRL S-836 TaxID=1519492 RepID=UPI0006ADFFFE|nr:TIR domain-containing protein [Nocardia sp. NRRL S-836]KOV79860.1 hypothetical protein ADL03_35375 [Nocardia sp. NRRL S-836]
MTIQTVRIFLSWCRRDKVHKEALLHDLRPALRLFTDLRVEWWGDDRLMVGEEFTPAIVDRIDECDFGLLLTSTHYLVSPYIRKHELPRFAGPAADKGALPVMLGVLPPFGSEIDFGGLAELNMFSREGKSYSATTGPRRAEFAIDLAAEIRRRALGQNGYTAA